MSVGQAQSKSAQHTESTVEAQRQRLFHACAVVRLCAIACAEESGDFTDREDIRTALECAAHLIDEVAGALQQLGRDPLS